MLRGRNDPAPDRDADDPEGQSRWAKSGTACVVVLAAILIVSGATIAWSRLAGDNSTAATRPPVVPGRGSVPVPAHLSGSASASPTPRDATWLQVGLGALPFSPSAGPAAIRAGVPSGFARTQAGAVTASMQILGRLSWAAQTKASMRAVATCSTLPSAAAASLTYDPPSDPSVIPAIAGFQVESYSTEQAVINIALRFNGTLRAAGVLMQWSGGDWKLAGAPGPLSQTSWAAVDDLTGYILFSGQPTKVGD